MAILTTRFQFTVEDPAGESDPWFFDVKIPPVDTVDKINELLKSRDGNQFKIIQKVIKANPDALGKMEKIDAKNLPPSAMFDILADLGDDALSMVQGVPIDVKIKIAELIRPSCGSIQGLTNGSTSGAIDWDDLAELDGQYRREVLFETAKEVLSRAKGRKGAVKLKNSNSS